MRGRRTERQARRRGRHDYDLHEEEIATNPHQLRRNKRDGVFGGVCAGFADYFGIEIWQVRVLAILGLIFLGHITLPAYLILWVILPKASVRTAPAPDREEEAFWREVSLKPAVTFGRLKYAFRDLEDRLAAMEKEVTSDDYRLRKAFKEIER